jgi:uncharacterized membrane protein YfhO
MDPAWQGYRGVSAFTSMANERTANLESRLGLHSNFINSYNYNPNTPVFNAMHNIKYLVENQSLPPEVSRGSTFLDTLNPMLYTRRDEFTRERFTVLENKYPLSVAFWADDDIKDWETTNQSNPFLLQQDFWNRASNTRGDVFVPLETHIDDASQLNARLADAWNGLISFDSKPASTEVSIFLSLYANEASNAYIYASADYVSAIHIIREDRPDEMRHPIKSIWDIGEITHEKPLRVEIRLHGDNAPESGSFNVYSYAINMNAFEESYNVLAQGTLRNIEFTDTHLKGVLRAPRDGVLYTSIPYDEGWSVFANGRRIPQSRYIKIGNGSFLGVPIKEGVNEIELKYEPQGLRYGVMISSAALILFVLVNLLYVLVRRKKRLESLQAHQSVPQEGLLFLESSNAQDNICTHTENDNNCADLDFSHSETGDTDTSDGS